LPAINTIRERMPAIAAATIGIIDPIVEFRTVCAVVLYPFQIVWKIVEPPIRGVLHTAPH